MCVEPTIGATTRHFNAIYHNPTRTLKSLRNDFFTGAITTAFLTAVCLPRTRGRKFNGASKAEYGHGL